MAAANEGVYRQTCRLHNRPLKQDIQGILTANRGLLDLDWVRREWWAVVNEDDPAKLQFEQFVREFYDA